MAKTPTFILTHLRIYPKRRVRLFTTVIEDPQAQEQQQQLTKIAGEICDIIRTRPKWENTLISHFPQINLFDPRLLNEVLKLQANAFLSIRLFNWLSSQSGFCPDVISCKSLFDALVKAKAFVVAKSFIDSVPQFSTDPDSLELLVCGLFEDGYVDEAIELFGKLKSLGVCPSNVTWNKALYGSVKVKRTDVVWKLYGEMIDSGVAADVETVGHLIEAFCIDDNVNRGYELLRQIQDSGVAPGNAALTRLICGLSKNGSYDKVSELLHFMISTNRVLDLSTYQGVLYGLCKRRAAEGYRIFNDLKARGYALDRVMYTTMMYGLCRMRQIGEARKLWFEMIKKGMLPNEYTYHVFIHGYCRMHNLNEALKFYREMCDRGYKPATVVYNTLIGGLCKNKRITEACSLFEEMAQNGVVRDVITYNTLIGGLCKQKNLAKAQMLFQELMTQEFKPSTSSYSPLIEWLCKVGSTQQALQLWADMMNKGLKPSVYNGECIITGFCKEGSPIEGMEWLFEMLERKLFPQKSTFERLIQCLSQQDKLDSALHVLDSMLHIGYQLGKVLSRSLVSKLCSNSSNDMETQIQHVISTS